MFFILCAFTGRKRVGARIERPAKRARREYGSGFDEGIPGGEGSAESAEAEDQPVETAIDDRFRVYAITPRYLSLDYTHVLMSERYRLQQIIENELSSRPGIKANIYVALSCSRLANVRETVSYSINTPMSTFLSQEEDIGEVIKDMLNSLIIRMENLQREGSGWIICSVDKLHLNVTDYLPTGVCM